MICKSERFLLQVCHIILGMKPESREAEGSVVNGWLGRELKRGFSLGQTWYLIPTSWWRKWTDYISDNVSIHSIWLYVWRGSEASQRDLLFYSPSVGSKENFPMKVEPVCMYR